LQGIARRVTRSFLHRGCWEWLNSTLHFQARILSGQPASPVSGVLFPGGGESPTFPQVRLGCPSLWSAISGISALAGRVFGSGLWWRFSNFRFGGAETGSTADNSPWYSRRSTVPGLRGPGRSAPRLSPRAKPSRCFAVFGSISAKACSWMCQQMNRVMRSLEKTGGGDDRKVTRHRVRSSSNASSRSMTPRDNRLPSKALLSNLQPRSPL